MAQRNISKLIVSCISVLLLGSVIFYGQSAWACECVSSDHVPAFTKYDVIFVGRAKEIDTDKWVEDYSDPAAPHYLFEASEDLKKLPRVYAIKHIRFEVKTPYKGVFTNSVDIFTRSGGKDCGSQFEYGEDYVVYAKKSNNFFKTSICTPTRKLAGAEESVKALDRIVAAYQRDAKKFGWLYLDGAKQLAVQLAEQAFVKNEYKDAAGNRVRNVKFSAEQVNISQENGRWFFVWAAPDGPWANVSFDRDGSNRKVEAGFSVD